MNFEYWFPTVTALHKVSDITLNDTDTKINAWISSGKHSDYLEQCKEDNLSTSYFKWHDTLGDLDLNHLRDEILEMGAAYAQHLGLNITSEHLKVDSWINFFYPGQSEQQHNHYGNFLSGVYYVSSPEGSGVYRFYDPAAQKTMWRGTYLSKAEPTMQTQTTGQYKPERGMAILFPSWLEHCVLANKSNDVRISLAFNVNFK